ncbi:F420-dependent methylene-tetrahydromethanopterin reductase [Leifsonia sp. Leaf336]|uniref:NtaA/DmoA family FMN-dependent monooxygenase n=1 Tax=Leifsonia sp. Leaf336 TaxID=1736341 RepID=UPI0006F7B710|nr:NtaA/DmoA family FMN-dependent monooxygenase [Leifsonia sp. Leaf336]KQR51356.1 F420-dependent methylene-tetrahydromethanopterin reductase [Leifsonia sp. Leaf336]
MSQPAKRRLRLAAGVPGVNHWTVWGAPDAGSQIDFSTFEHVARTAERGFFDYFFLAEGLRVREHKGRLHELDVAGRPDNFSALAAVAAVTEHIGLVGTASATFNEPYDLARRIASLDHLSGGRAGWNIVTSSDAFTGANFRRGGYLDYPDRYRRAGEFVELSRALWDSWDADGPQRYRFEGEFFDTEGWFPVAPGPQGHPVLVQAGDSGDGRDFAVTTADVVFSRHGEPEAGRAFRSDIRARALAAGRDPDGILVIPAVSVVLGDTPAEAEERARETQFAQVTPQTAIHLLEQVWGVDLSAHDPEGPVPTPPDSLGDQLTHGQARRVDDPLAAAHAWHAEAVERDWSIRELVVAKTTRHEFVGTPAQIAERLDDAAQTGAADGYVLSGSVVPHGIDEFVARVVPLLQERGVLRTSYEHPTLRENLGLGDRPWVREGAAVPERAELAS